MENKNLIPTGYVRYEKVIICSNVLVNVEKIIDDKGFVPLFIGKGTLKPNIWLKAKAQNGIIELIKNNQALVNVISVNYYENENQMTVTLDNKGEVHLILQIDNIDSVPNITKLDLRTIGYNIYGSSEGLNIGTTEMKNNTYQVNTFIGM